MRGLISVVCLIFTLSFCSLFDRVESSSFHIDFLEEHTTETPLLTQQYMLDMPMDLPIGHSSVSQIVVSSTHCRTIGKYRFNNVVPVISERSPIAVLFMQGESLIDNSIILHFSNPNDYYIYWQRRILI